MQRTDLTRPSAVVFDWDNTLVDTWPVIHAALSRTFEAMGHDPWSLAETKARVSKSLRDSFPGLFGDRWEEAREVFYATFREIHLEGLGVLSGAETLLQRLKQDGVPMAIVSNKTGSFLRTEVAHLGWTGYFAAVVGAGDAARDKPDPAALRLALAPLKQPIQETVWFIGDSRSDLELAKAARCTGILVHPDHEQVASLYADCAPHASMDRLDNLTEIISAIRKPA